MPEKSIHKWKPIIDLRIATHRALAMYLIGTLRVRFGGRVDLQKELLAILLTDRITNGAAYEMIEHLAARGYLRFERWGPGRRYKRVIVLRPLRGVPSARSKTVLRIQERGPRGPAPLEEWPEWTSTYLPGPPNHRKHLARHAALAAKWGWP